MFMIPSLVLGPENGEAPFLKHKFLKKLNCSCSKGPENGEAPKNVFKYE
jgi:predicted N-acyltransferase